MEWVGCCCDQELECASLAVQCRQLRVSAKFICSSLHFTFENVERVQVSQQDPGVITNVLQKLFSQSTALDNRIFIVTSCIVFATI